MKAVVLSGAGGPDVLQVRDVPVPVVGANEILVRVHTTALNRADILQREGHYPAPLGAPRDIPGIEFAGEVAACGPGATEWHEGDRVYGVVGGGAYAEYLVTHARAVAPVPRALSWVDAGAVPEAFITAHDALLSQAHIGPGDRVLVHAVGSGVGLAAVQLIRAVGAIPYGTARGAAKLERAKELGMEDGWLAQGDLSALAPRVRGWTDGVGMNVVLDLVGGDYVRASIDALANKGWLLLVGTMAGAQATISLGQVLHRRLTLRGTVLRARPLEEKVVATRAFAHAVNPLLECGVVRAVVDSEFPLDGISSAHRRMESNATIGKVVVRVAG